MSTHSLHLSHLCIFFIMTAILSLHSVCTGDSVTLEKRYIKNASLYVVTTDLNDPEIGVSIRLAAKGIPHSESFQSMVKRSAPIAAVTGTYFDTRSLFPVGSIVSQGQAIHESAIGTAVCFIRPDRIECVNVAATQVSGYQKRTYEVKFVGTKKGDRCDWAGVECGLRAGPRLLSNGQYALNPKREGFRHPGLFGARTRVALGHTPHNKLLLVAVRTPVTFAKLASIMKALGATEAVALDGGTSSAMYYRGRIVCSPGRALTNIIEIRRIPQTSLPDDRLAKKIKPVEQNWTYEDYRELANIELAGGEEVSSRRHNDTSYPSFVNINQYAILSAPIQLSFSKSRHSVFPIDRAKLTCLKSLNYSKNFVNIPANTKIMNNLIS